MTAFNPTQGPTEREIQDAMDALRPLRWASEDSLIAVIPRQTQE